MVGCHRYACSDGFNGQLECACSMAIHSGEEN